MVLLPKLHLRLSDLQVKRRILLSLKLMLSQSEHNNKFRSNQEVSFEDLMEPVEEISQEDLQRAFYQNKEDKVGHKIREKATRQFK